MKKTRNELGEELKQKAETLIEEVLDWYESNEMPNMSQIEGHILKIRQKLSEEVARLVIQGQEAVHPEEAPPCPQCGRAMSYKGEKEKRVDCLIGEVGLERAYYHCSSCKEGLFPPGSTA